MNYSVSFPSGTVQYYTAGSFASLHEIADTDDCIVLTDNHIATIYHSLLAPYRTIVIQAGEDHKTAETISYITDELLKHEAHRRTTLIALGGGMITDIGGYAASTYMRGLHYGFVPTTILGMVDAAIGGKNGINHKLQKNLLGTISQPQFILYDSNFLQSLPAEEWSNGFAEVIKYACLFDKALFNELEQHDIEYYRTNSAALNKIIETCADWKNKIVLADERETGARKLLNFGHTTGHAFETLYQLPHGYAVALGMMVACQASIEHCMLDASVPQRVQHLLQAYKLPVQQPIDIPKVMDVLRMDKKRNKNSIDFILLTEIGNAVIKSLSPEEIQSALVSFSHASHS